MNSGLSTQHPDDIFLLTDWNGLPSDGEGWKTIPITFPLSVYTNENVYVCVVDCGGYMSSSGIIGGNYYPFAFECQSSFSYGVKSSNKIIYHGLAATTFHPFLAIGPAPIPFGISEFSNTRNSRWYQIQGDYIDSIKVRAIVFLPNGTQVVGNITAGFMKLRFCKSKRTPQNE
jgi:hypothetical protein